MAPQLGVLVGPQFGAKQLFRAVLQVGVVTALTRILASPDHVPIHAKMTGAALAAAFTSESDPGKAPASRLPTRKSG